MGLGSITRARVDASVWSQSGALASVGFDPHDGYELGG
jgi:hypothetical protein